jgi:hypothetical protein
MRKQYQQPALVEYGSIERLTLGSASGVPDLDQSLNDTNTDCPTEIVGGTTRLACLITTSGNI